jgi:hypothetical protein
MSCRAFLRIATGLVAAASFSFVPAAARAGGCGCEGPSSTVYHMHSRCHQGHCRHSPPVGMVVQSAPMMAAPMMAAPMMAAPMMMAAPAPVMQMSAPVMQVAAPTQTFTFAPVQAAPQATFQLSMPQQTCGANMALTQEQLVRALTQAMDNQANSPARAPSRSVEDRLTDLEQRVGTLESATKDIVDLIRDLKAKQP